MSETEVIRKTLRLTPELVEEFARLRLPEDRNETETFARLLRTPSAPHEATEARQGASALSGAPEVPPEALGSLHEALSGVSEGVRGIGSTLAALEARLSTEGATEARRALTEEVQRFRTALQEHSAWFEALESGLQKSHDAVTRASVGFRELLPSVQKFSLELSTFQKNIATAHENEHKKAHEEIRNLASETSAQFRSLTERYEKTLSSLVKLPERLSQDCDTMSADLVRYRALTGQSFHEQVELLKGAHAQELALFRKEAKASHIRNSWLMGVPTALLTLILAFLLVGGPLFEKYESDKMVREVLEPSIQKYATDAIVKQNAFLDKIQVDLEKKLFDMVAKQGVHVENATKEFRKEAFDAHKRAGESAATANKLFDYWNAEKSKNKVLQDTNSDLAKKAQGEWGFWDGVGEHTGWFLFCLIFVSFIAGIFGYMFGKR